CIEIKHTKNRDQENTKVSHTIRDRIKFFFLYFCQSFSPPFSLKFFYSFNSSLKLIIFFISEFGLLFQAFCQLYFHVGLDSRSMDTSSAGGIVFGSCGFYGAAVSEWDQTLNDPFSKGSG